MRTRRLTATVLAAFSVLTASLVFAGPSAFGAFVHEYQSQITGTPTGPEKALVPFGQPWGLAFDANNNLLVADAQNQVIDAFDSTNTFAGQVGSGVFPDKYARSVAVNNTTGVVYVADSGPSEVFVFKPEGSGKYQLLQKRGFGNYMYVAVNNSTGPRAGDVYVISGRSRIYVVKPDSEGRLEEPGEELAQPSEEFSLLGVSTGGGLAVDGATGKVYVANPGHGVVDEYDSNDVPLSQKLSLSGSFEPVGVAVDESNGEVYVLNGSGQVDQFSSDGGFLGRIKGTTVPFVGPLGVAVKQTAGPGDVYVSDGTAVDVFGPDVAGGPEAPVTEPVTAVIGNTAVLHGELNPLSKAKAGWYFAYNKGNSCRGGLTTSVNPETEAEAAKESATINYLQYGAKYTGCMVAENEEGPQYGSSVSFETEPLPQPPAVLLGETAGITPTQATLSGTVNPNSGTGPWVTIYYYQYGTSISYTQRTGITEAGPGNTPVAAPTTIEGLQSGTTYHYRLVAENAGGTSHSADEQFTTLLGPPPVESENVIQNPVSPAIVIAALSEPPVQPLLALPPIAFPKEETGSTPKRVTTAQRLANALKACHAKHVKQKRNACEKQARRRFGSAKSRRGKK